MRNSYSYGTTQISTHNMIFIFREIPQSTCNTNLEKVLISKILIIMVQLKYLFTIHTISLLKETPQFHESLVFF